MPLHYLDENDEPRECDACGGFGKRRDGDASMRHSPECDFCAGAGRIGNADGPRVDIARAPGGAFVALVDGAPFRTILASGPTAAAALAAAREAHARRND